MQCSSQSNLNFKLALVTYEENVLESKKKKKKKTRIKTAKMRIMFDMVNETVIAEENDRVFRWVVCCFLGTFAILLSFLRTRILVTAYFILWMQSM